MVRSTEVQCQQDSLRDSFLGCKNWAEELLMESYWCCWLLCATKTVCSWSGCCRSLMLQEAVQGSIRNLKVEPLPFPASFQYPPLRDLTFSPLAKEKYFRVQLNYHRAIDLELRGNNLISGTWNTELGVPQSKVF